MVILQAEDVRLPPPQELGCEDLVDHGPGVLEAADPQGALRGQLIAGAGRRRGRTRIRTLEANVVRATFRA